MKFRQRAMYNHRVNALICLNDSQQDTCLCCIKCVKQLAYGRARDCAGGVGVTWFAAASHPGAFESPGPSLHQSRGASAGLPSGTPNFHQPFQIFLLFESSIHTVPAFLVGLEIQFYGWTSLLTKVTVFGLLIVTSHVLTVSLQALVSFY